MVTITMNLINRNASRRRSVGAVIAAACVALSVSTLPALGAVPEQAASHPQQSSTSPSSQCSVRVDNPHWSNKAETIHAKAKLICWNTREYFNVSGFFGFASGGKCGYPALGPYGRLWQKTQIVRATFGQPGSTTFYIPMRSDNPHYGASGTYYASASVYLQPAASIPAGEVSDDESANAAPSAPIAFDDAVAYVGGQCQG